MFHFRYFNLAVASCILQAKKQGLKINNYVINLGAEDGDYLGFYVEGVSIPCWICICEPHFIIDKKGSRTNLMLTADTINFINNWRG